MKFFNLIKTLHTKRLPNFVIMLLAVFSATAMWYVVSKKDIIEAVVPVILDFTNIPPNLTIVDGLTNRINVRLSGPETLIRGLPRDGVHQSMNLNFIKKGENTIPFVNKDLQDPLFRAFTIIDIDPPKMELKVDNKIERTVPVKIRVISPLDDALTYEKLSSEPTTVIISGPAEIISKYSDLTLEVRLNPEKVGEQEEQILTLNTPNFVIASPPTIKVKYTVTSDRKKTTQKCPVIISGITSHDYQVDPPELEVLVEVPEAFLNNKEYLDQCRAFVAPPEIKEGRTERVKIRFDLPEGMKIIGNPTTEVFVSRKPAQNEKSEQDI